jgi:hypothetical protein
MLSNIQVSVHVQSTPASTWTITHNFDGAPTCDVIIPEGNQFVKILPLEVRHLSDTQLVIEFSVPRTGRARLVGKNVALAQPGSIDPGSY